MNLKSKGLFDSIVGRAFTFSMAMTGFFTIFNDVGGGKFYHPWVWATAFFILAFVLLYLQERHKKQSQV